MSVLYFNFFEFELFFSSSSYRFTVDFVKMFVVHFDLAEVEIFLNLEDTKLQHWEQLHYPYVSIYNGNLDLYQ